MRFALAILLAGIVLAPAAARRVRAADLADIPKMEPSMIKTYVGPKYPYEARRHRIGGSGVVVIDLDSSTGRVNGVSMATSTGDPMLD